jgi:tetratricopeptide (TPR) repeat protein
MKGAFAEAIAQCRLAVEHDPLLETPSGNADVLAAGSTALRAGDLSTALKYLRAAIDANPGRSEAHRLLGMAFRLDEQFDQSIEQYKAAVQASPMDERARIGLADVLIAVDRFSEAEDVLKETIRAVPGTVQAHYRLGRLYQSQARYGEAAAALEQSARFTPLVGQDPLYEMLGAIYVTQTDFQRATTALRKQLAVNPNNADAHRRLADVYVRQDRTEEALAEFMVALFIDPRNVESYVGISQVHLQAGRYAEAGSAARAALNVETTQKEAHYVLAMSLLRMGNTEGGDNELREFQRLQAEAASKSRLKFEIDSLRRESTLSLADADYGKAIPLLQQLVAREPSVASHYINLGDALMKSRQPEAAAEKFEEALKLEPSNPGFHRLLAEAYAAAGQSEASRREADRYRALIDAAKRERLLRLVNP